MTVVRPSGSLTVVMVLFGLLRTMKIRFLGARISLPSTLMWSVSRFALLPSSVTAVPFTVTLPSSMIFSAWRREATPAGEGFFGSRSWGFIFPGGARNPGPGQLARIRAGLRAWLRAWLRAFLGPPLRRGLLRWGRAPRGA